VGINWRLAVVEVKYIVCNPTNHPEEKQDGRKHDSYDIWVENK
jgi:hypothetical protein